MDISYGNCLSPDNKPIVLHFPILYQNAVYFLIVDLQKELFKFNEFTPTPNTILCTVLYDLASSSLGYMYFFHDTVLLIF